MDLVIWGHEPTCMIEAEWNESQRFHVSQPGSATRVKLTDTDKGKRNVGLLRVATLLVRFLGVFSLMFCGSKIDCVTFFLHLDVRFTYKLLVNLGQL